MNFVFVCICSEADWEGEILGGVNLSLGSKASLKCDEYYAIIQKGDASVTMPLKRLRNLQGDDISETLSEIVSGRVVRHRQHLGGRMHIEMCSKDHIEIYQNDFNHRTEEYVVLNVKELDMLLSCIEVLSDLMPEFAQITLCVEQDDHMNQLGAMECSECHAYAYWM